MLIETLGYCSILEVNRHKGFLNDCTILELAPQKSHSSDWTYPADWLKGENKLNKDALMFWFGNYTELKKYIESL